MKDIKELIESFGIKDPRGDKEIVTKTIKEVSKVEISIENIEFLNNNVKLSIPSAEKNTIFFYKDKIIEILKQKLPERRISRIS